MKVPTLTFSIAVLTASLAAIAAGQSNSPTTRNNPYSPSPSGKVAPAVVPASAPRSMPASTPSQAIPQQLAFVTRDNRSGSISAGSRDDLPPIVEPKPIAPESAIRPATNRYRIGVGDVVFINLKNSPQGSGYYTVRENGEIDYPLAGPNVSIANKKTDEAAAMLRSAIKLFADPQVEVKVQYYLSRSFSVEGLVINPGEKVLRREAMPIFAIRAESEVKREATTARITRATTSTVESYELSNAATDNVVVLAGDRIEFVEERKAPEVQQITLAGTKKPFVAGTKLSQAISDALGQNAEPKQAVVRRFSDMGVAISEYDINAIKKSKVLDPILLAGDIIEIKN